jgi:DNA uptake protein ComE-like DNA-binding protein
MTSLETSQAVLGQSHGYRIDGDLACLNAELALSANTNALAAQQQWALQLWACDQPYQGGALQGIKVAEAAVDLSASQPQHMYAETFARLPAGDREYAMVLVLASRHGADGAQEQVHDFANYPAREHFNVPALRGDVTPMIDAEQVTLRADRIENPRTAENLSGTLALELWALDEAYRGAEQFKGTALAGVELGRLRGQAAWSDVELRAPADVLEAHTYLIVMLREWTASGYVTRDYRNLPRPAAAPRAVVAEAPAAVAAVAPAAVAAVAPAAVAAVAPAAVAAVAPAAVAKLSQPAVVEPAKAATSTLVSVQHATLELLAAVPGLNKKLAQEIVKARPFRSLDDLTKVRGIGEKTLRKLRAVLTL